MSFFKRNSNPIFIEEEQYNWRSERSTGKRLLLIVVVAVMATGIVMVMLNQ